VENTEDSDKSSPVCSPKISNGKEKNNKPLRKKREKIKRSTESIGNDETQKSADNLTGSNGSTGPPSPLPSPVEPVRRDWGHRRKSLIESSTLSLKLPVEGSPSSRDRFINENNLINNPQMAVHSATCTKVRKRFWNSAKVIYLEVILRDRVYSLGDTVTMRARVINQTRHKITDFLVYLRVHPTPENSFDYLDDILPTLPNTNNNLTMKGGPRHSQRKKAGPNPNIRRQSMKNFTIVNRKSFSPAVNGEKLPDKWGVNICYKLEDTIEGWCKVWHSYNIVIEAVMPNHNSLKAKLPIRIIPKEWMGKVVLRQNEFF